MNTNWSCGIWDTPAVADGNIGRDGKVGDSPRAGGRYFINRTAQVVLQNRDRRLKARLTTWLVEQRRLGNNCPEITTETIREVEARRDLRVSERADEILKYLETQVPHVGARVTYHVFGGIHRNVNLESAEVIYFELLARSESVLPDELRFLIDYLRHCGYVEVFDDGQHFVLTVSGYERLAVLASYRTPSMRAFVAMWFDPSMHHVWEEGIRPGISAAGYEPIRIDQAEHTNKIDDEIVAEIKRSRFVVADFTQGRGGARGGVYYEAGYAHGLNIPVIFTCRSDVLCAVHFDTRQYNHIVWDTPQELCERLTKRIGAVIREGPL